MAITGVTIANQDGPESEGKSSHILPGQPIEDLGFSGRICMRLWAGGIETVQGLISKTEKQLLDLFGARELVRSQETIQEVKLRLTQFGLTLAPERKLCKREGEPKKSPLEMVVEEIEENVRDSNWLLKLYLQDIREFRPLSIEKIMALSSDREVIGAKQVRDELVVHHLQAAVTFSRRFLGRGVDYMDLIQEGNLGLIIAGGRFKYQPGATFLSYAYPWMKKCILSAIYDHGSTVRFSQNVPRVTSLILKASSKLASTLGRVPTIVEVAKEASLLPHQVEECLQALKIRASLGNLAGFLSPGDEKESPEREIPPSSRNLGPDQLLEAKEELAMACARIRQLLSCLKVMSVSKRDLEVFRLRYGLGDSVETKTLEEIGERFGTHKVQIHRILKRVWEKLEEKGFEGGENWLGQELEKIHDLEDLTNQIVEL